MKRLLLVSMLAGMPVAAHAQDVVVLGLTCTMTSAGPEIQGEVKNLSSQPLARLRIIATFRDISGNLINLGESYPDYRPLLPGQISPFGGYGDLNPAIVNATIVVDNNSRIVASSGKSSAPCR